MKPHPDSYVALTIAGSDPSGGAGLQADLKTFQQHGVYGMSVVTLLTVQNTQSVTAVQMVERAMVSAQLDAVISDIPPNAAKLGALGNAEMIELLAARATAFRFPLVIDPVMISKHGQPLMDDVARSLLTTRLLPFAFLVTPNRFEAAAMTGRSVDSAKDFENAARALSDFGAKHVLIKGLVKGGQSLDLLWSDGNAEWLSSQRTETQHTHGSGCVYSAAITSQLARNESLINAVIRSKRFITDAIQTAPGLGQGRGPVNLFTEVATQ
jgi:hydroxymethylpyrimidine/phosphomethylpyrimidine kinase